LPDASGDVAADAKTDAGGPDVLPDGASSVGICPQAHGWTVGKDYAPDAIARFGGVSSDEQSAAWTRIGGVIVVADRTSPTALFAAPKIVPAGTTTSMSLGRVAIDTTGNQLVAVDNLGSSLIFWSRAGRGSKWASVANDPAFDAMLAALPASTFISEPVFAAGGSRFLFLLVTSSGAGQVNESNWDAAKSAWGVAQPIAGAELATSDSAHRRRPTGMSSDGLTLFYFEEGSNLERAAWRATPTAPFAHFEDLAGAPEAVPGFSCSSLYYRGNDTAVGSAGLFLAE
jgi:hypothetical protein